MRSWLYVPADDERKLARLGGLAADVVVLDIAAVAENAKPSAREAVGKWLKDNPRGSGFARWVRIEGVESNTWKRSVEAVIEGQPDGIVLSDANDPDHPKQLAAELWEQEQTARVPHGTVHIMPQLAGSAQGTQRIEDFLTDPPPRMTGLSWDALVLAKAIGAQRFMDDSGRFTGPFSHVQSRLLLAARALGLMAVDTPWQRWRDDEATVAAALAARQDGFTGMAVVHPRQISPVNAAFAPSDAERTEAQAIIDLFEASPEASAVMFEGRMIDRPQLEHARRIVTLG